MIAWSIFCDIAGLVREKDACPWNTLCAVAIKSDNVDSVKSELLNHFNGNPVKFRDSTTQDLIFIFDLLQRNELPCATIHIRKNQTAWRNYWKNARKFHGDLSEGIKKQAKERKTREEKPSFAKKGNIVSSFILGRSVAALIAILISEYKRKIIVNSQGYPPFVLDITFDMEIQDEETQQLLRESFEKMCLRLQESLGIALDIHNMDFKTEEEEPLLLLPDYIAGSLHQRLLASKGKPSKLRPELIQAARELKLPQSKTFEVREEPFEEEFPFTIKNGRIVWKERPLTKR